MAARLGALGVPVTSLPRRYAYEPARILALARAFKRDGIDVVHAILPAGAAYGALAARLARVPTVDRREPSRRRRLNSAGCGACSTASTGGATAVVANTWAQARALAAEADLPLERVQVVYDGVDLSRHAAPACSTGSAIACGIVRS